jgi:hypothetical protein
MELVFVLPPQVTMNAADPELRGFARIHTVEIDSMHSTAQARAAGIREASAPVIVFTEDHSFPEPSWAEALIHAHQGEWAVVGPQAKNANPRSVVSWANFLGEYSEWFAPNKLRPVRHLPGHNSAYKKDILLAYAEKLGKWLEAESLLHWDLVNNGHKLHLESKACTRHMNFSRFFPSIPLRFFCGRHFAGLRRRLWPVWHRLLYVLGAPLIPLVRLYRIIRLLIQSHQSVRLIARVLPCLFFFLVIDAAGEMMGYAFGSGNAAVKIVPFDFHRERFITRQDKEQLGY